MGAINFGSRRILARWTEEQIDVRSNTLQLWCSDFLRRVHRGITLRHGITQGIPRTQSLNLMRGDVVEDLCHADGVCAGHNPTFAALDDTADIFDHLDECVCGSELFN